MDHIFYDECATIGEAWEARPESVEIVEVEGGFACFDNWTEYEQWEDLQGVAV